MSPLVQVHRGGQVESSHDGHIAVVTNDGKLLYAYGDPYRLTFARSSSKPLQAIQAVESGAVDAFGLDGADLALICASHSGEARHTERVRSILKKAGLTEEALRCGPHIPRDKEAYKKVILEERSLTSVYNNCSGKHAGMLVTAKHLGEPLDSYMELRHPVQQRNLTTLSEMARYPKGNIGIGIDGCGVPTFAMPLYYWGIAFAQMARPTQHADKRNSVIRRITNAMVNYPEMVAGKERFDTDLMRTAQGRLIGKGGAEGVFFLGDREQGISIVVKIEDGSDRAVSPVVMSIIQQLDLLTKSEIETLKQYLYPPIKNTLGSIVGYLTPSFTLKNEQA